MYMRIMYAMVTKEFFDFAVIISVMIVAFAGSFSLALRLNGMLDKTGTQETGLVFCVMIVSYKLHKSHTT